VRKCNYPYSYVVENLGLPVTVTVDGPWTHNNHLLLDFIGHELYEVAYRKVVSNRNSWKNEFSKFLMQKIDKLKEQQNADLPPELEKFEEWFEKYGSTRMREQHLKDQGIWGSELEEVGDLLSQLREKIDMNLLAKFDEIYKIRTNGCAVFGSEINLRSLYERYKLYFSGRRIEYLAELIKRTAGVKFTLDYPLQHPVIEPYIHNGERKTKITGRYLDTVKVENCRLFKYKIEDGILQVKFNTFFGKLYTHNLLTLNSDWFDEDYLKLNGYASVIYRRFFLNRKKVDEINLGDIVEHFGFSKNSRYPEIIKQAFGEMKKEGLIEDFNFVVNGGKFSKGYVEIKMPSN
jgi:hypothetical protein